MSTLTTPTPAIRQSTDAKPLVSNPYGYFAPDGKAFCITNWRTPRPWANVISNRRVGLAVTQTGSGFSWIDNSQLAVVTRWDQDLVRDSSGKFIYVRDLDSGALWSLSPAPTFAAYDHYLCRHGLGFSTFETEFAGIRASWTLFVHATDPIEFWRIELANTTDRPRRLDACAFLEWCCGVSPSPRREFHKLFIDTKLDLERRAIFASNHMWDVPARDHGHWNASFPYVSALAASEPVLAAQGDKGAFLGRYGDFRNPQALSQPRWQTHFGRHEDPIAALRSVVELRPGQRAQFAYALATTDSAQRTTELLEQHGFANGGSPIAGIDRSLSAAREQWTDLLGAERVETPEPSLNYMVNDWVRYQAISARIWGRAGYYQQSGAYGFRDQLQDSQIWLTIDPAECRTQANLHAKHQFADGSVYHWWHPLSEQGLITTMTDDLLWLGFVAANYIRETGDLSILTDEQPFLDDEQPAPLVEHVLRAFERVFQRTSPRGIPYMGAGDWNDGLNAVGLNEKGESFWLGMFLAGLLGDWTEILRRSESPANQNRASDQRRASDQSRAPDQSRARKEAVAGDIPIPNRAADFELRRTKLIAALNEHAWDGEWYRCATRDDGQVLGSKTNRVCRVYLNTQTWAILNDIAPAPRAAQCFAAMKEHLVKDVGALLLTPAFDQPDENVGYITRYAPGLRENGGVYTHAATWAISAAAKMGDHELVGRLLTAINPAVKDPERYWAEPYVLPGNVDGPESPYFGRGGWTWYTGSAQWLHRVVTQWVLGVRPEWDGLRIDPVLPPGWTSVRMTRPWRGVIYDIQIERVSGFVAEGDKSSPGVEITLDGLKLPANLIPAPSRPGGRHEVRVRIGRGE